MTLTPTTIRLDLKCGRGSVSQGEKCTKGTATKTARTPKKANLAEKGLMALGAAGTVGSLLYAAKHGRGNSVSRERAANAMAIAGGSLALAGTGIGLYGTRTQNLQAQQLGGLTAFLGGSVATTGLTEASLEREHRKRMETVKNVKFETPKWNFDPDEFRRQQQDFNREYYQRYGRYQNRAGSSNNQETRTGTGTGRRTRPNAAVPNPFQDLGVSEKASDTEIKNAWKKLMRQNHPDIGGDPEKAKRYNAAYQEILRRRGKSDSIYADGFKIDWSSIQI